MATWLVETSTVVAPMRGLPGPSLEHRTALPILRASAGTFTGPPHSGGGQHAPWTEVDIDERGARAAAAH